MQLNEEHALKVAEFLLQIKAVQLNPDKPFTWASGWKSPIYCDNRKTLSYPKVRTYIRQQFTAVINDHFGRPDVIAGVATGGIALGALVAEEMGLPFAYIRSSAKEHGMGNLIEGVIEPGQNVMVIEDLVSTGKSSLTAVEAIRDVGASVKGMAAIFTYGFQKATDAFAEANCKLLTLSNYDMLLLQCKNANTISEEQLITLQNWRKDPANWGQE